MKIDSKAYHNYVANKTQLYVNKAKLRSVKLSGAHIQRLRATCRETYYRKLTKALGRFLTATEVFTLEYGYLVEIRYQKEYK